MKIPWATLMTAFLTLLVTVGSGCTHDMTGQVGKQLVVDDIYQMFEVRPQDLAKSSKCGSPPIITVVNSENRPNFVYMQKGVHTWQVNPQKMIDQFDAYLIGGYAKSGIQASDNSSKVLQFRLADLNINYGMWSHASNVKIALSIPEINHSQVYEDTSTHINDHIGTAFTMHNISRKIIDDPKVQAYLLCR